MNPFRNPTGTRDFNSYDIAIRDHIINIAKQCYSNYGAEQIDTPKIELYNNVKTLYGEEFHKLVYKFRDEHDDLILRYDLTVPFARYVGANSLRLYKRYQIGSVYRCDNPQISKGRYREFLQADFDIAGSDQGSGVFDMEILQLTIDLLTKLLSNKFTVRLNHKTVLLQYLKNLNIPTDKMQDVCTSIDKLDKKSVDEICKELLSKGIDDTIVATINEFIKDLSADSMTSQDKLDYLVEKKLIDNTTISIISNLLQRIDFVGIGSNIIFDPLLARGLDYYTGIIFEANYNDKEIMPSSICAGGRYDGLIGKFSNHGDIPAVGMSLGIERIVTILEETKGFSYPTKHVKVYVASIGKEMINERIKLCNELRKRNVKTIMSHLDNPKMKTQFDEAFKSNVKFMVVIGPDEIKSNTIKIKDMPLKKEDTYDRENGIKILEG